MRNTHISPLEIVRRRGQFEEKALLLPEVVLLPEQAQQPDTDQQQQASFSLDNSVDNQSVEQSMMANLSGNLAAGLESSTPGASLDIGSTAPISSPEFTANSQLEQQATGQLVVGPPPSSGPPTGNTHIQARTRPMEFENLRGTFQG